MSALHTAKYSLFGGGHQSISSISHGLWDQDLWKGSAGGSSSACEGQGHGWHSWWLAGLLSPGRLKSAHVISPPGRVWVSSQHGCRSTRSGHPREQRGSRSVSHELALEVTECHFGHPLVARTVINTTNMFQGTGKWAPPMNGKSVVFCCRILGRCNRPQG